MGPPTGLPCPHSFYFCSQQLNLRDPCLALPQPTAHGREGTQPQAENNSWARAELSGGRGEGRKFTPRRTASPLAHSSSVTSPSPVSFLQGLVPQQRCPGRLASSGCRGEGGQRQRPAVASVLGAVSGFEPQGLSARLAWPLPPTCQSPSVFV